jgi:hypothetical protein
MRKVFLILIVVLCAGNVNAQLRFGVKAGVNFSKFSTKYDELKESSTGFQVGIVPQFKIPLIGIGLQPELLYSLNKSADISIGYFQLPVLLRWQPLPIPLVKPVILVGPYWGYAVNLSSKLSDFNKDDIKRNDWGLCFGAGVEVWKLQVSARYSLGLQNINGITYIAVFDDSIKNSVWNLSAVLFFN